MKWFDRIMNRKTPNIEHLLGPRKKEWGKERKERDKEWEEIENQMLTAVLKAELAAQMGEQLVKQMEYYNSRLQGLAEALTTLGIDTPLKNHEPNKARALQLRHLFEAHLALESLDSVRDKVWWSIAQLYVSQAATALMNSDSSDYEQYRQWVAPQGHPLVCPTCFSRFGEFSLRLDPEGNIYYQGCPHCHTLEPYLEGIARIISVVDHAMEEHFAVDNSALFVNWLAHKEPLDFAEVLIRDGDDADIEELVMKLRNDADEERRKRYGSVPVHLSPTLRLSQAKLNLLKDTFGRIQTLPASTRG